MAKDSLMTIEQEKMPAQARAGVLPGQIRERTSQSTANLAVALDIRTVRQGFYEGFNPVVTMAAKLIIVALVAVLVLFPEASGEKIGDLKEISLQYFASWYNFILACFVVFCLVIVCLPGSGRIRMGEEGAAPEHSTAAWLSMMFCAGIGGGILTFSISEPISHFGTNPDILASGVRPGSESAVVSAMRFVFLHWGLSAWACYAVIGLALGLACHRYGQPLTMRSGLSCLFGKRLEGPAGHTVDVISILAIIAGITTTIVLGLEQICSGLSELTGSRFFADHAGAPPLTALLTALVVSIAVAIASVVSGVERGVNWTSQCGVALAMFILCVFVIFGGGVQVFDVLWDGVAAYLSHLPVQMAGLYDPALSETARSQRIWQGDWTIFYWAWWIAFAPFVGLFLARISRGRSLREFILGAILMPTSMCFVWFAGTGGTALLLELDGTAGGNILSAEHAFRIYEAVDAMLTPGMALAFKAVLVFLFLILIVASSTAAIIAIKSIGGAGAEDAEAPAHSIIWAFVIAAIVGAVMAVGGVGSVRDIMIISALPFSVIMALKLVSVTFMILAAQIERRRAVRPVFRHGRRDLRFPS